MVLGLLCCFPSTTPRLWTSFLPSALRLPQRVQAALLDCSTVPFSWGSNRAHRMAAQDREEHYVLRVQDRALAERIKGLLRAGDKADLEAAGFHLHFNAEGQGRNGKATFQGEEYPLVLLDLPTVVESYKSYNDEDLVKSNDIGQVLLVLDKAAVPPEGPEYRHGITPPMRNVRNRLFKTLDLPEPAVMRQLAHDLELISKGSAPAGMEITDTEEVYEVDANGVGRWKPSSATQDQQTGAPSRKPQTKSRRGGGTKRQQQQQQNEQLHTAADPEIL